MDKEQKITLAKIIVTAALLTAGLVTEHFTNANILTAHILVWAAYAVSAYETILHALKNIVHGKVFDEHFLMSVASIGAICLGSYSEAVAVMLFYAIGEFFEDYAVDKSKKSIESLMAIKPDYANVFRGNDIQKVAPDTVAIGDIILIKPGEKVPLDGIVIEGTSALDTSAITGESVPRDISEGKEIYSGCINISGTLKVRVTGLFGDSTVSKIIDMVENASSKKAPIENFITKFARVYTPVVVFAALAVAVIPPLFAPGQLWGDWIYKALLFLVISCPCALVISVPLSFFGGIGAASRAGILVKGGNYLEALNHLETVIFDKTGTLTTGSFSVSNIKSLSEDVDSYQLLGLGAAAEMYSDHPIALSIKQEYGKPFEGEIKDSKVLPGKGASAVVDGIQIYAGNENLMNSLGHFEIPSDKSETLVHIATGEKYLGYIAIADTIKDESADTVAELKDLGIKRTVMLTGDRDVVARRVGDELDIDEIHSELLPGEKLAIAEKLIHTKDEAGGIVAFVGDGINDAPVLAGSDIGIAMGGMGSPAAIDAADIVIMDDNPHRIIKLLQIAKKTLSIAKSNVVFSLVVKGAIFVLGFMGIAGMWTAVFADVGVAIIAILNAMRALRT